MAMTKEQKKDLENFLNSLNRQREQSYNVAMDAWKNGDRVTARTAERQKEQCENALLGANNALKKAGITTALLNNEYVIEEKARGTGATGEYYSIDVRGWKECIYILCHTSAERDRELQALYDRWETDDEWRVCNPVILVSVHRYSKASLMHGRY